MDTPSLNSSTPGHPDYVAARDAMFNRSLKLAKQCRDDGNPFALHLIRLDEDGRPSHISPTFLWNVSGKVKPGMTFRHCRECQREALVIAISVSGFCEVLLRDEQKPTLARVDDLIPPKQPIPRLSLPEHLDCLLASIEDVRYPLELRLSRFVQLFSGLGEFKPDGLGYVWAVRAYYLVNFSGYSPELTTWAALTLENASHYGLEPAQFPDWLHALATSPSTEDAQPWPGRDLSFDEVESAYRECIPHIRDAVNRLKPSLSEIESQDAPDYVVGDLAINIHDDAFVWIMGLPFSNVILAMSMSWTPTRPKSPRSISVLSSWKVMCWRSRSAWISSTRTITLTHASLPTWQARSHSSPRKWRRRSSV